MAKKKAWCLQLHPALPTTRQIQPFSSNGQWDLLVCTAKLHAGSARRSIPSSIYVPGCLEGLPRRYFTGSSPNSGRLHSTHDQPLQISKHTFISIQPQTNFCQTSGYPSHSWFRKLRVSRLIPCTWSKIAFLLYTPSDTSSTDRDEQNHYSSRQSWYSQSTQPFHSRIIRLYGCAPLHPS